MIGYRLKSPSFSYFAPYFATFALYITDSLNLEHYQLSISAWEDGNRITMYLKLFPSYDSHLDMFNKSEVYRIETKFTSWGFPPNHFFGPYELLNFTLVGPYATSKFLNLNILLFYVICVANLCHVLITLLSLQPIKYACFIHFYGTIFFCYLSYCQFNMHVTVRFDYKFSINHLY